MDKWYKQFLWVTAVLAIGFGISRGYFWLTDDFRLGNITDNLPYLDKWAIPPLKDSEKEDFKRIFSQKFTYFGKGAQCYALVSDDGKYVLKFFKFKHLRTNPLMHLLPPIEPFRSWKAKHYNHVQIKLHQIFDGYHLSYTVDKEYSGLVFIHLNQTHNFPVYTTIIDKIGLEHHLNLDPLIFVLQKNGKTLKTILSELLVQDDVESAQEKINQVMVMYLNEYKKGLYDRDHSVLHNAGFVDNQPFHLDAGRLCKNPAIVDPVVFKKDLDMVVERMKPWLKDNFPQYYPQLMQGTSQYLTILLDEPYPIQVD